MEELGVFLFQASELREERRREDEGVKDLGVLTQQRLLEVPILDILVNVGQELEGELFEQWEPESKGDLFHRCALVLAGWNLLLKLVEIRPNTSYWAVFEAVVNCTDVVNALLRDFHHLCELYQVLAEDVCQDCQQLQEVCGHD